MRKPTHSREVAHVTLVFLTWLVLFASAGCARAPEPRFSVTWIVGRDVPVFDPGAPPDPLRWSLERLVGRGLLDEDSTGAPVPAAAERHDVTADGLTYTFHLRPNLRFGDGSPCTSEDFRLAIESSLNRLDHGTHAWLLGALVGVDHVRAGRPLPPLGIATPDPNTLVLRLARPDSLLPSKLALPGVAVPWPRGGRPGEWRSGLGDYRVAATTTNRMTLVRRATLLTGPDSIHVRFERNPARVRAALRAGTADLVWPIPARLLSELPAGAVARTKRAVPDIRLLLVLRADLPPTSRPPARHALAHGLDGAAVLNGLRARQASGTSWLTGGAPFEFPRHDPEEIRSWLERGKFRGSLHVVLAYSADGPGAEIARALQSEWARFALDIELRPLAADAFAAAARSSGGAQLLLVEYQGLLPNPATELAGLVTPTRGPGIGGLRTGWRTRELDPSLLTGGLPVSVADVQDRLSDDQVVLPIARLPWLWIEASTVSGMVCHPHFGPDLRSLTVRTGPPS
jgi:ABC-type transport system substrate-binding protein